MATNTSTSSKQEFREDAQTILDQVIDVSEAGREAQELRTQLNLATLLSKAQIFDDEVDEYKAFAKIQIGKELGLQPAESMRAVFFGQNGPDIDIHTRVALAMRSGKYKYDIEELNASHCRIQWYRKDNGLWTALRPIEVSIDQIKHIMIWEKGKQIPLSEKWNYKSWREDMQYAFVQRRAIRRYAIETQGSFAPSVADEEAMEEAGVILDAPATRERATESMDALGYGDAPPAVVDHTVKNEPEEIPSDVDADTGEVLEDPSQEATHAAPVDTKMLRELLSDQVGALREHPTYMQRPASERKCVQVWGELSLNAVAEREEVEAALVQARRMAEAPHAPAVD